MKKPTRVNHPPEIALPPGVTATYANAKGKTATVAGPGDAVEMCEGFFSRANG